MSEYIIGNLHVCEQARSARLLCNITIFLFYFFIFLFSVYTYVSWFFSSFYVFVSECLYHCVATLWLVTVSAYTSLLRVSYSFSLWISVLVFGYIMSHWSHNNLRLLIRVFSLSASIGFRQYCHWFSVYNKFVFWSAFRFIFLSICLSIRVYNR